MYTDTMYIVIIYLFFKIHYIHVLHTTCTCMWPHMYNIYIHVMYVCIFFYIIKIIYMKLHIHTCHVHYMYLQLLRLTYTTTHTTQSISSPPPLSPASDNADTTKLSDAAFK